MSNYPFSLLPEKKLTSLTLTRVSGCLSIWWRTEECCAFSRPEWKFTTTYMGSSSLYSSKPIFLKTAMIKTAVNLAYTKVSNISNLFDCVVVDEERGTASLLVTDCIISQLSTYKGWIVSGKMQHITSSHPSYPTLFCGCIFISHTKACRVAALT